MKSVAFGSCNRQDLPQGYWDVISKVASPDLWVWMGDAVYSKNNTLSGIVASYNELLSDPAYQQFSSKTPITGVWDDHDYGINDAGRIIDNFGARRQLFLNFTGTEAVAPVGGVYSGFDKDMISPSGSVATVRFILLDTRSFRDSHWIRSLGELDWPFTALIGAAFRASYTMLGLGWEHSGDVLGERQWEWLEEQLADSPADFHVLVSSIQVFTSNPVVESWGHFPLAKTRLLRAVEKHDPRGLVFLSGDIHMGEVSQVALHSSSEVVSEITSSGLTHTCANSFLTKALCPWMISAFSSHRSNKDDFLLSTNFGMISLVGTSTEGMALNVSVVDIATRSVGLSVLVPGHSPLTCAAHADPALCGASHRRLTFAATPQFPRLSDEASSDLLASLLIVIALLLGLLYLGCVNIMTKLFPHKAKKV